MTLQEYEVQLKDLKSEYEQSITKLAYDYAIANKTFDIGDTITYKSQGITIVVDAITWSMGGVFSGSKYPHVIYKGVCLTKSLKPYKNGRRDQIHQHNAEGI